MTSPAFSIKGINRKSVGWYFLTAVAVGVLSNLSGLEKMLLDFFSPATVGIIITMVSIILKKIVEKK